MTAINVFLSYWYQDEDLKRGLEAQLGQLEAEGVIDDWCTRVVGADWKDQDPVDERLREADLVLFLVSSSLISSRYVLAEEAQIALARHRDGVARLIPILLRPCQWQSTPLAHLTPLPSEGRPLTLWPDRTAAWGDILDGVRRQIAELNGATSEPDAAQGSPEPEPVYPDENTKALAQELETAHLRRAQAAASGSETAALDASIQRLKGQLRADGRLRAGDILGGRYRLLEPLGSGHLSQVWRSFDRESRHSVAIKTLLLDGNLDRRRRQAFVQSAQQQAKLAELDGVARVLQPRGKDGEVVFQVQELLTGGDFRQLIQQGTMSVNERLAVILEVGETLEAAHQLGVVHKDVRPEAILFDSTGNPKLTNFDQISGAEPGGHGRSSDRDRFLHVAPEAVTFGEVGPPADVYGLGMTTLFALHGKDVPPALAQSLQELMASLQIPTASLPVIEKALAWKAADRWPSVRQYCDALHQAFIPLSPEARAAQEARQAAELKAAQEEREKQRGKSPRIVIPKGPTGKPEGLGFRQRRRPGAAAKPSSFKLLPVLILGGLLLAVLGIVSLLRAPGEPAGSTAAQETDEEGAPMAPAVTRDCAQLARRAGIDMQLVPAGVYTLGTDEALAAYGDNPSAALRSQPSHSVQLSAFWISTFAITNEQYDRFVNETGHPAPEHRQSPGFDGPRQPVVGVSWRDAEQLAQWAGMQLPSEAQWEAAARGNLAYRYPWGNGPPTPNLANYGGEALASVDDHPDGAGPFGTLGQAGGVWEWCRDVWSERPYVDRDGAVDPVAGYGNASRRVARGGSWSNDASNLVAAVRLQFGALDKHRDNLGFRLVCEPGPTP